MVSWEPRNNLRDHNFDRFSVAVRSREEAEPAQSRPTGFLSCREVAEQVGPESPHRERGLFSAVSQQLGLWLEPSSLQENPGLEVDIEGAGQGRVWGSWGGRDILLQRWRRAADSPGSRELSCLH